MCGICGFNFADKELITKMTDTLSHRGPDGNGIYVDSFVSLGHRRLKIIDLSEKGKQPMCNEDGSIQLIFNGEIYNYKELRKQLEEKGHRFNSETDSEVIIHAYEEYGFECLGHFNGEFAFCIYDSNQKRLFLARDRLGIKPLYYYTNLGTFIFASEIKAILEHTQVPRIVNESALNKFMSYRYISGEQTILERIRRLLPGHYMIFENQTLNILKYWDIQDTSLPVDLKQIYKRMEASVEMRLRSDVPLGAYLSGGIDSSTIVALMSKLNNTKINTFSVGFGDKDLDELKYAKIVSDAFHTNHKEFIIDSKIMKELPKIIWHLDEPIADPAILPIYFLAKETKKYASVVLTGEGGDELFGGYEQAKFKKYKPMIKRFAPFVKIAPPFVRDKFFKFSSRLGEKGMQRFNDFVNTNKEYDSMMKIFDDSEKDQLMKQAKTSQTNLNTVNEILKFDLKNALPDNLLMKMDKMTMAHGVEARVPFLDHTFVEYMMRIPADKKVHLFNEKLILKQTMKTMLPKKIIMRNKQRFYVPIDKWITPSLVEEMLNKNELNRQGYFNYAYVRKIMENYNKSKLFYARQLWNLITFQIWHKTFIDQEEVKL